MPQQVRKGRRIVCALHLTPAAPSEAAWAAFLSQHLGADLTLFHAIHFPSDPLHPIVDFERDGSLHARQERSRKAIQKMMQEHDATVSWDVHIEVGDPAEALQQFCHRNPVDLVITGSRGIKGVKRLLLGTVVERLAHHSICPMLVIRNPQREPRQIMQIGICCDFKADNALLTQWGQELARLLNARICLLHAMESAVDESIVDPTEAPYNRVQQMLQERLAARLLALFSCASTYRPLSVSAHIVHGSIKNSLLNLVRSFPIDLLIVGVHPHSAFEKWVLGSTTEAVLRRAPCDVLTVPIPLIESSSATQTPPDLVVLPTGTARDPIFLKHDSGSEHIENPLRLRPIYSLLDKLPDGLPVTRIELRAATEKDLMMVHSAAYVRQIAATAGYPYTQLTADTYACADSFAAASLAAGAVLAAIDAVVAGRMRHAFVLVRPPGHHAEINRANGYCLFNNAAIGARYARRVLGFNKVLIVDWDLHHGNGIQHIFEQDPSVLYFSTHQYPLFPGTGHVLEVGRGRGEGYTINVPLGKGLHDADFALIYQSLLEPAARAFKPDLILVAAGFDIHKKDPMGKMKVTETGFAALTRMVMQLAQTCCKDRLVLVLEGGYHPKSLAASIRAVLLELCGQTHCDVAALAAKAATRRVGAVISRSTHVLGRYWPGLIDSQARRLQ
jgi:acetoin utilization deacetylase AcuC-like enzyme/nucleotide-binding universal stress UspA family protein